MMLFRRSAALQLLQPRICLCLQGSHTGLQGGFSPLLPTEKLLFMLLLQTPCLLVQLDLQFLCA
jgi:hypothetical protein